MLRMWVRPRVVFHSWFSSVSYRFRLCTFRVERTYVYFRVDLANIGSAVYRYVEQLQSIRSLSVSIA